MGLSWAILGDLGAILGDLGAILGHLEAILGDLGLQLCVHLGSEDAKILVFPLFFRCFCCVGFQVIDGRFSVALLHPGGMLSPTWRIWEPTRAHFRAILSYVGATLGDVGAIRGHLAPILGCLGRCWGSFHHLFQTTQNYLFISGLSWGHLGSS